jgi:hypothetical protein
LSNRVKSSLWDVLAQASARISGKTFVVQVLLREAAMRTTSVWTFTTLAVIGLSLAAPVCAQTVGIRAGVSGNPDQFYAGIHTDLGPVADQLWFRPNLELGVGDNTTTTAINVEFAYKLDLPRSAWQPYVGGGPALNLYHRNAHTDAEGGFNILLGVEHQGGFFTELKVGLADSPNVKFGVGYVFRR